MPYYIKRAGSKFKVVTADGRVMGTHDSRSEAEAQRRAIYANEKKVADKR